MRHLRAFILLGLVLLGSGLAAASSLVIQSSGDTGITSLNSLTGATQTFGNETNLQVSSSGTTHTLTWASVLSAARGGTGANNTATSGTFLRGDGTNFVTSGTTIPNTGTSGGLLGYTGTGTLASSGLLTQRAMLLGGGAGVTPNSATGALSNGQIYIGRSTTDPIAANLTAGANITITNADGSINIAAAGGSGLTSLNSQTGSTQTFANDTNVQISSGANTHTLTWASVLSSARGGTGANNTATSGTFLRGDGTNFVTSGTTVPDTGTSGGILGYTASGTLASSAALVQRAMVIGGGAGATPTTATAALTNGQLYIGRTGADPVAESLQPGAGISITNQNGTIRVNTNLAAGAGITLTTQGDSSIQIAASPVPVFGRVVRTAGDLTTTSTSLVDVTGATVTFTTGAFPINVAFAVQTSNSTATAKVRINIDIDGTLELGTVGLETEAGGADENRDHSFALNSAALTAASHTAKAQWSVGSNTGTLYANSSNNYIFSGHEIR